MRRIIICALLALCAGSPASASIWLPGTVVSMKVAGCAPSTNGPKDKEMPCHEYVIRGASLMYRVRTTQERVTVPLPPGQHVEYHAYGHTMDIRVAGTKRGQAQHCVIVSRWKNEKR